MVAAPLSFGSESASGPRPLNLRTDIPRVLALLNLVFQSSLHADGRRRLNSLSLSQYPWPLLYLRQWWRGAVPGFVWEEEREIVGNVSLLTTSRPQRYLIANVAVHPAYRRQGIARLLMEATLDHVEEQGGGEVLLQVKHDNAAAIRLYETLGFVTIGSVTSWVGSYSRVLPPAVAVSERSPDRLDGFLLRPLRRGEWQEAWQLDRESVHPDLNWPVPPPPDTYRRGWLQKLTDLLNGRQLETWVAEDPVGTMAGLGTIVGEWGRSHTLSLRIRPAWQGEIEPALLAKLLRRVHHLARREIRVEHPASDEATNTLLQAANFRRQRTLTVMRFDF